MQRVRITVRYNPEDPVDDLRRANRLRRDLWAHSPVTIDPDAPEGGTLRDANRNAFFEFVTDQLPEVHRVLRDYGYADRTMVDVVEEGDGTECVNCRKIAPQLFSVCPNCSFRDVEPCPYCDSEVSRLEYIPVRGDLFTCPKCHHRVWFRFNE